MAPVLLLSPKLYKISSSRENPSSASIEQKKSSQQQKQQLLLISTITKTTKHLGNNKLLATTTTTATTANYSLPHSTINSRSSSRSSSPFAQFAIPPTFNTTINNPTPTIINNNNDSDDNNNNDNDDDDDNSSNNNNYRMFKRSAAIIKLNNNNHEYIKPININSSKTNNNVANDTNNNAITNNNNNSTIDNNYNFLLEPKPIIIKSKEQLEQQEQQRQEQYLQLSSPFLRTSIGWTKHNSIAPTKSTYTASINSATTSKSKASKSSLKSKASSLSSSTTTTSSSNSTSNSTSSSHVSISTSKSSSSSSSASNNVKNNRNVITLNQGKKSIQDVLNKSHRTEREVKSTLSKLRRLILDEGIPEENLPKLSPSIQNLIRPDSLRSTIWKRLLGVYHVSASDYVRFIKKGKSCVYEKIRSDTFRTMATDQKFLERVNEEMLIRLLNATAWKMKVSGNQSISYVQGMNVLAAPFLYTMSELDAYCSFVTFIQTCCPLYVTPNLQGVHCGIKLLEKCLKILDVKLFNYLKSKNLTAIIYALPSVLTFCACTPSLDELLKLWDFLFAYGVHLNILCIIAQLVLIRDQLLEAPSPMKLLRTMPKLDAKSIINLTVEFVQKIPNDLYDLLVRHPFDSTVESLVID